MRRTQRRGRRVLPSQQLHEPLNRETCVGDDPAQCTGPNLVMIWNNHSAARRVATQDRVTASLAAEDEAGPFQGGTNVPAG
jgi:hypothetical protein